MVFVRPHNLEEKKNVNSQNQGLSEGMTRQIQRQGKLNFNQSRAPLLMAGKVKRAQRLIFVRTSRGKE